MNGKRAKVFKKYTRSPLCDSLHHVVAPPSLRSRRSLRSLVRYARHALISYLTSVSKALKIIFNSIQNPSKIDPKSLQHPFKIHPKWYQKSKKNLSKIDRNSSQIAPKIHPKSHPNRSRERLGLGAPFLLDFGRLLGGSWPHPGASWAPSWRQVGHQNATKKH